MSSVTLRDVHKRYGKVRAVNGISMDIADGEFIAFLGPSGCGKSSTMRMIAGLEEVTEGDILFDNSSVIATKASGRNVAMAFENYALYPTLTVYENIAFPLRAARRNKTEIDRRVREIAEIVRITDLLNRKPGKLSSGQSQAVGLARALIRNPNVLLLDEPISHLDTSQRFQMRLYIKRLHIELGCTMILVTHDQEDAMSLADRVAVMSDGRLNQIDTPRQIYDHPTDLFVAGFIGDLPMNFLEGTVEREEAKTFIRHSAIRLELSIQGAPQGLPEEVVLGIRPSHLKIQSSGQNNGSIGAEVFVVEPLGDMNVVTVQMEDLRFQVIAPSHYRASPGAPVRILVDRQQVLLFDKKTGRAISSQ